MAKTERMTVAEVERSFGDVVERVSHSGARIVVEHRGTPLVAIVPVAEAEKTAGARLAEVVGSGGEEAAEFAELMAEVVRERAQRPPRAVCLEGERPEEPAPVDRPRSGPEGGA